ncbi:hypothetical protein QQP08_023683 [Theobroma cacao]|nr:hypothetical protein QQP08_023683 [Theobroma cacao]
MLILGRRLFCICLRSSAVCRSGSCLCGQLSFVFWFISYLCSIANVASDSDMIRCTLLARLVQSGQPNFRLSCLPLQSRIV